MATTLEMFRAGMDTLEIARKLGRKEQHVLKEISELRSVEMGRLSPYAPLPVRYATPVYFDSPVCGSVRQSGETRRS